MQSPPSGDFRGQPFLYKAIVSIQYKLLFINIKSTVLNARQIKLVIYNILGNEIQAETEIIDDHEVRVRVKELSTGYYLIAVRDEQTQFRGTYKFLKR